MAKITIGTSVSSTVENTALQTAKVFIYKFDKDKNKDFKQRGYVKEQGVGYTVEVSIKDDEYRIKLFENGEKKRVAIVSEKLKENDFEQLEKGFALLQAYFKYKPLK